MFLDVSPQEDNEKLSWYETTSFNLALFLGCFLAFLSMVLVAVVRAIRNRRPAGNGEPASRGARIASWIIVGISVLNLLFIAGTVMMFSGLGFPRFGFTLTDRIVLGLGVFSALLTVGALIYMVLIGGWLWGLLAATRSSRRGLIVCLIAVLLLDVSVALATYFFFCPPWTACTGWPNAWPWNWSNLISGAIAAVAIAFQLRQKNAKS